MISQRRCWIPSKAGKPFRIGYTAHAGRKYGLKVSVYIDGELTAEQTHGPRGWISDGIRARKDGFGTERPFYFSKRTITGNLFLLIPSCRGDLDAPRLDNDLDVVPDSSLSQLGSIQVKFTWILVDPRSLSERPARRLSSSPYSHDHHRPIYEGLVKHHSSAIAHAAGLGATRKLGPKWMSLSKQSRRRVEKDIPRPGRWTDVGLRHTTFEFKYAPMEYLEAEGILQFASPPSSSPPTPPHAAPTHSPWRSHIGTPYRELRADASFSSLPTPNPIRSRPYWFARDSGLDFNTPERPKMKLGSHVMTNYTPLAKLGNHVVVHPVKMSPLVKLGDIKPEQIDSDDIVEITSNEFYGRDVVDLTGLDSDDE
ncbi:hypothetical protein RhiJN_26794 [Ceratobasidium sp. AG-Ba]|nr:hypothetical protein RhiJN_26794 [Ceratobasidium sp. AG-Ba]